MHPEPSLPIYPTHHPLTKGIIDGTSASTRMISNATLRTVINIYTGTPPFSNPSDYIGHIRVFVFFQPIYISAIGHYRLCSHVRTLMASRTSDQCLTGVLSVRDGPTCSAAISVGGSSGQYESVKHQTMSPGTHPNTFAEQAVSYWKNIRNRTDTVRNRIIRKQFPKIPPVSGNTRI